MQRGEVWWARIEQKRPVVLLSGNRPDGIRAMVIVPALGSPLEGVDVEVTVGARDGLPFEGVLRVALTPPGLTTCNWLITLAPQELLERAGMLSAAKLAEIETSLRRAGLY